MRALAEHLAQADIEPAELRCKLTSQKLAPPGQRVALEATAYYFFRPSN